MKKTITGQPINEVKHTPGPWEIKLGCVIMPTEKDSIYSVAVVNDSFRKKDIIKANARLITAAPDMLEALKQLYNAVKDIPEVKDYLDGNLIQANEAILKATNNQ